MDKLVSFISNFGSRKFLITVLFSSGLPILFKAFQIGDTVTLASLGLCASYLAANVFDKSGP